MAIVMRMTMMAITTIISTKVKPRRPAASRRNPLPIRIVGSIGRFLRCFAIHVEDVLSAPTLRFGVVLIAAQSPILAMSERIHGNAPQQIKLLAIGSGQFDAIYQNIERLREAISPGLDWPKEIGVTHVFVLVDGPVHLAQRVAQFTLPFGAHFRAR